MSVLVRTARPVTLQRASRNRRGLSLPILLLGLLWGSAGIAQTGDDAVARGRYLATVGECAGCHSASAGPYAGGREFQTKFGVVESANITPDQATGIGNWSDEQFYRALHEGRSANGSHLYPAFPYPYFTKLTRADADAIHAFLRTVAPVANSPHRNRLAFPMNIRGIMGIWNALYFRPGEFQPDPARSPAWNRGAYIVTGPAHCGACHSPKNVLEADSRSHPFEGGVIEGWFAPNLTGEPRTGLGSWSEDEIVQFLQTGRNPHTAAGGLMANVVQGSASKLDPADIRAVAVYLKGLPASAPPLPVRVDPAAMSRGAAVYAARCASCHAEGAGGLPLRGAPNVQAPNPTTLIRYVLSGTRTAVTAAHPQAEAMPGLAGDLSDQQTADVLSYIRNAWGNAAPRVGAGQVAKIRAATVKPAAGA